MHFKIQSHQEQDQIGLTDGTQIRVFLLNNNFIFTCLMMITIIIKRVVGLRGSSQKKINQEENIKIILQNGK